MQADALGGLSAVTRKLLDGTKPLPKTLSSPRPKPGQRLAREFAGRIHEVTVMADHVLYEGVRFGSLSEAARFITGKRWNGPRFFGLRERSRP